MKAINGFGLATSIALAAVPSASGADDQFFRDRIAPDPGAALRPLSWGFESARDTCRSQRRPAP